MSLQPHDHRAALAGVLLGTAIGDALGLPMEGLSARRQQRLFPGPLRHWLVGRRGMVSDDTEHTFMVAQSLLEAPDDPSAFARALARRLRWWLLALPAGVGLATLRAIVKLWFGVSPARSGVWSAGNGPAMRSALLGVYFAEDPGRRAEYVRASTRITHRDPRAETAALAVAETAAWMCGHCDDLDVLWTQLAKAGDDPEWRELAGKLRRAVESASSVGEFAAAISASTAVSGYAYRSVPVAIFAAIRHRDDFSGAMAEVIACGGDTDTTAAITGALVGARLGGAGIPQAWVEGICDWPLTPGILRDAAERLAAPSSVGAVHWHWPGVPLRNVAFLLVVLAHGLRRLFPPY